MHKQYNTAPLHMAMLSHITRIDAWCIAVSVLYKIIVNLTHVGYVSCI